MGNDSIAPVKGMNILSMASLAFFVSILITCGEDAPSDKTGAGGDKSGGELRTVSLTMRVDFH